ncbi:bifunctional folylpolyglutamate synthase/dihydrofolate synthase [Nitratifractor salsuginis]|uniref:FolC bifunctional protein n=1 Tax=Nitratifractor salsuginis (strain DSM 16511 / JCM 12458 / E9I37-1) TaxID=749222 RepID=E6WZG0_NITSE|nr:bifunctional folylpolyglutamate synthase/dihydrofolate synthase [Nitratifractor salsuginis]ADV45540.1 FolC bifunctional protein [Nitratifractor salsuginis DSM 16511]
MTPAFFDFLEQKPLYYKEIDTQRIHNAYALLKDQIAHPPAVHIVGTNGKGSTGRMIAYLASQGMRNEELGIRNRIEKDPKFSIGHYTSPHILRFNERIWIDGAEVSDEQLEEGHRRLYEILGPQMSEELSYFEYTTLLALLLFEHCDLIVLEAGLGGEFDATNVVENKRLSVVTPIGLDHQAFLGDDIESIARTKCKSFTPGSRALLAPQPYPEVPKVARQVAQERGVELHMVKDFGFWILDSGLGENTEKKWAEMLNEVGKEKGWPDFLLQNALTALKALELLGIEADPEALRDLELFGRFYPLRENIRIDVGHNPLAARVIAQALEPETVLIYNSLDDKDYWEVLSTLKPKIKRVELIPIESQRAATLGLIEEALEELEIPWNCYDGLLFSHEKYLVFGSFYTVEAFLRSMEAD